MLGIVFAGSNECYYLSARNVRFCFGVYAVCMRMHPGCVWAWCTLDTTWTHSDTVDNQEFPQQHVFCCARPQGSCPNPSILNTCTSIYYPQPHWFPKSVLCSLPWTQIVSMFCYVHRQTRWCFIGVLIFPPFAWLFFSHSLRLHMPLDVPECSLDVSVHILNDPGCILMHPWRICTKISNDMSYEIMDFPSLCSACS